MAARDYDVTGFETAAGDFDDVGRNEDKSGDDDRYTAECLV